MSIGDKQQIVEYLKLLNFKTINNYEFKKLNYNILIFGNSLYVNETLLIDEIMTVSKSVVLNGYDVIFTYFRYKFPYK